MTAEERVRLLCPSCPECRLSAAGVCPWHMPLADAIRAAEAAAYERGRAEQREADAAFVERIPWWYDTTALAAAIRAGAPAAGEGGA